MKELQRLEIELKEANNIMKKAVAHHNEILLKLAHAKNVIENNKTLSQKADDELQGFSKVRLFEILNEYFELMQSKSIAGLVMIDDIDGVKNNSEIYNLIILNCGGKLIFELFGFLLEKKVIDGEVRYPVNRQKSRVTKRLKMRFNRRLRRAEIIKELLKYGTKCNIGIERGGVE